MAIEECYICGRAFPYLGRFKDGAPTDPWYICKRAGCKPEREHMRERVETIQREYWPIVYRFQTMREHGKTLSRSRHA